MDMTVQLYFPARIAPGTYWIEDRVGPRASVEGFGVSYPVGNGTTFFSVVQPQPNPYTG